MGSKNEVFWGVDESPVATDFTVVPSQKIDVSASANGVYIPWESLAIEALRFQWVAFPNQSPAFRTFNWYEYNSLSGYLIDITTFFHISAVSIDDKDYTLYKLKGTFYSFPPSLSGIVPTDMNFYVDNPYDNPK
jgi:hypothetical protein